MTRRVRSGGATLTRKERIWLRKMEALVPPPCRQRIRGNDSADGSGEGSRAFAAGAILRDNLEVTWDAMNALRACGGCSVGRRYPRLTQRADRDDTLSTGIAFAPFVMSMRYLSRDRDVTVSIVLKIKRGKNTSSNLLKALGWMFDRNSSPYLLFRYVLIRSFDLKISRGSCKSRWISIVGVLNRKRGCKLWGPEALDEAEGAQIRISPASYFATTL